LLRYMHRHAFSHEFEQSLAVMGEDGTLAERPLDAPGAKVRAKTGTLTYASALSGYLKTDEGREFAFSILCNGFLVPVEAVHQVQDSICSLIATNAEALIGSGRVKNPARH
jgi:D-alanyl-D-alanine carboxypeptidase/D-alanyl-D-alanine-endopeptidase (penicillin-binding protein 4)